MTYWFTLEPAGSTLDIWVQDAVDRAFDGPAWLRPRFPAGREVVLHPRTTTAGDVRVTGIARVGGSRKRLTADLHVPAPHRASRFGLLHAAAVALSAIGTEFALGPCPLRDPARGVRAPLAAALARPAPHVPPGRLLLLGGDPADGAWHAEVAARLGATPAGELTWTR
jgi:hypothetical protein